MAKDKALPAFMEPLARRPHGRLLRWLAGRDPAQYGVGRPLFFHHVPKTAGTSLIKAIGKMVLPELTFSECGNLFADVIYVVHAFQKKTRQTAKRDVDLPVSRLRKQMARLR